MKIIFTTLLLAAFITACATTDKVILDSTPRPPTTQIDVYKDANTCTKPFKAIAELTFLGPREDELKAQRYFIKQAQALGGNGILFGIENAGMKGNGFGVSMTYIFKAKVITYN